MYTDEDDDFETVERSIGNHIVGAIAFIIVFLGITYLVTHAYIHNSDNQLKIIQIQRGK